MLAQAETVPAEMVTYSVILMVLLISGALGWFAAAVLGFLRARAFGPSVRWFALASLGLLLHHLGWLVVVFALMRRGTDLALPVFAFTYLFLTLAAICAIVGFTRLPGAR